MTVAGHSFKWRLKLANNHIWLKQHPYYSRLTLGLGILNHIFFVVCKSEDIKVLNVQLYQKQQLHSKNLGNKIAKSIKTTTSHMPWNASIIVETNHQFLTLEMR